MFTVLLALAGSILVALCLCVGVRPDVDAPVSEPAAPAPTRVKVQHVIPSRVTAGCLRTGCWREAEVGRSFCTGHGIAHAGMH
jgi:hypothetical protein